jgi:hypothetical protein
MLKRSVVESTTGAVPGSVTAKLKLAAEVKVVALAVLE